LSSKDVNAVVVLSTMFSAISNLISSGTGVNSGELISDLLAASRQPKEQALFAKEQLNQSRISALASARSSLDTFAAALTELLDGRAFAGNLVSSDPSLASVDFFGDQRTSGLPASLEIIQIASSQLLSSGSVADSSASLGEGSMTISTNGGDFEVTLVAGADSLNDLVAAINQSASGVGARIVTDNSGSRLVVEGAEGTNESFAITGDFADYNYPTGSGSMSLISSAADAMINLDGIHLQYSSNQITQAIPGLAIGLKASAPGTQIVLSGDQPTSTVSELVEDFVNAYNELRSALSSATAPSISGASGGPLASDSGIRDMLRLLGRIPSSQLRDDGAFRSLSDIGVKTNNDGTLAIDSSRLASVLESDPDAVSAMLDPLVPNDTNPGLDGLVQSIRDQLQAEDGALDASQAKLDRMREELIVQRERLIEDSEKYEVQLQRNFANMDRQLIALQATQSYLTQQIAIWNGDSG